MSAIPINHPPGQKVLGLNISWPLCEQTANPHDLGDMWASWATGSNWWEAFVKPSLWVCAMMGCNAVRIMSGTYALEHAQITTAQHQAYWQQFMAYCRQLRLKVIVTAMDGRDDYWTPNPPYFTPAVAWCKALIDCLRSPIDYVNDVLEFDISTEGGQDTTTSRAFYNALVGYANLPAQWPLTVSCTPTVTGGPSPAPWFMSTTTFDELSRNVQDMHAYPASPYSNLTVPAYSDMQTILSAHPGFEMIFGEWGAIDGDTAATNRYVCSATAAYQNGFLEPRCRGWVKWSAIDHIGSREIINQTSQVDLTTVALTGRSNQAPQFLSMVGFPDSFNGPSNAGFLVRPDKPIMHWGSWGCTNDFASYNLYRNGKQIQTAQLQANYDLTNETGQVGFQATVMNNSSQEGPMGGLFVYPGRGPNRVNRRRARGTLH